MQIVICGSMQFAKEILEAKKGLESNGHQVVIPAGVDAYVSGTKLVEDKWNGVAGDLMKEYWQKIMRADAVLVVNHTKNGIEHYVGGNSLIEMAMAYASGKRIYLLHPIPRLNYSEEIAAMEPIVLNGDLNTL